jgi:hypothetical protein
MLMTWFLRGSDYAAVGRGVTAGEPCEVLDQNGDGLIDARDVLAIKVDAVAKGTEAMTYLADAMLDGTLSPVEHAKVRELLHDVAALVTKAIEAHDHPDNGKKGNGAGGPSMRVA